MNISIVITSIFKPTEAIIRFSQLKGYKLVVVGDIKTPEDWRCNNVDYIPVSQQKRMNFKLASMLPFNHYCRKMIGYLKAIQEGAECIIDTDDDNIPKNNYSFPSLDGKFDCIFDNQGFINIYQLYTTQKIWPRGMPLKFVGKNFNLETHLNVQECKIGIWQGLADKDPDVDAVYRLTNNSLCFFNERNPVAIGKGSISPFNTQNTMIRKELFALMYLPTYVTFRFTDILRGLIAQPIMWLYGYQLGFINATVVQERNPHDYMKDFLLEIPMYQHCEKVIEIVSTAISTGKSIENNIYNAYESLLASNIVCDKELKSIEAWLNDLENVKKTHV